MSSDALSIFHPLIRSWFAGSVGEPTDIQQKAWPETAGGKHVLVTAPTGSGKTLAAFLWSLDRLITGAWPQGIQDPENTFEDFTGGYRLASRT